MRSRLVAAAVALAVVATGVGVWVSTLGEDSSAGDDGASLTAPPPDPLSPAMVEVMAEYGIEVAVDEAATTEMKNDAGRASDVAIASFDFIGKSTPPSVSLGNVTVVDDRDYAGGSYWVVYLDKVEQPLFGGEGGTTPAHMVLLVEPDTMKYVWAASF